jgi:putative oxidoreductase
LGRVLFAAMFVLAAPGNFTRGAIMYAAAQGVPLAGAAVPIAGVLALVGGLSVAIGYRASIGALLLIVFLVPVTLFMHRFWSAGDPMMASIQQVNFLKNISMLGGAILIACFGAGPLSLDERFGRWPRG